MAKKETVTGTVNFPLERIYAALSTEEMWLHPREGESTQRTPENYDVSVDDDGIVTVHISQDLDGGPQGGQPITLAVRQIVTISPPESGEIRQSSFAKVGSIPGEITVETVFVDNGDDTATVTATGSSRIMVPMLGKVINQQFLSGFEKMVTKETDFMNSYLAAQET